jgi:hypothetical protein
MLRLFRRSAFQAVSPPATGGGAGAPAAASARRPEGGRGSWIAITSAPRSPSTIVQKGPGAFVDRSSTEIPSSGPERAGIAERL